MKLYLIQFESPESTWVSSAPPNRQPGISSATGHGFTQVSDLRNGNSRRTWNTWKLAGEKLPFFVYKIPFGRKDISWLIWNWMLALKIDFCEKRCQNVKTHLLRVNRWRPRLRKQKRFLEGPKPPWRQVRVSHLSIWIFRALPVWLWRSALHIYWQLMHRIQDLPGMLEIAESAWQRDRWWTSHVLYPS